MNQELLEQLYSYSYAMKVIREYIDSQKLETAMLRLYNWVDKPHYESKATQLYKIVNLDLMDELVLRIITTVASIGSPNLNTIIGIVSPWLEAKLNDNHPRTMKRVGEVTALLCEADILDAKLVDIPNEPTEDDDGFYSAGTHEEIIITLCNLELPRDIKLQLASVGYIPCMFEAPNRVKRIKDSPYYIHQAESLVNSWAEPDLPINGYGLDLVAGIRYKLATEFLKTIEPTGNSEHHLLATEGAIQLIGDKEFFLPAYYDTRGRQYARGWQVNYQGDDYHKSMISLADEIELI